MLIREGSARSLANDRHLAAALALVAGALNLTGFQLVGVFSASMTGNVANLADRVATGDILTSAFYLCVIAAFISEAASATLFVATGKRRGARRIYALAILAEAGLLLLLGLVDLRFPTNQDGWWLVVGLSASMGAQNATVTLISNARVRTTHLSSMATDVGIEVGRLLERAMWRQSPVVDDADPRWPSIARAHDSGVLHGWGDRCSGSRHR